MAGGFEFRKELYVEAKPGRTEGKIKCTNIKFRLEIITNHVKHEKGKRIALSMAIDNQNFDNQSISKSLLILLKGG